MQYLGEYQSGQLGRTVNPLTYVFTGSNPVSPTKKPTWKLSLSGCYFWKIKSTFVFRNLIKWKVWGFITFEGGLPGCYHEVR